MTMTEEERDVTQTVKLGHAFLATTDGADLAAKVRIHNRQRNAIGDSDLADDVGLLDHQSHIFLIWSRFEKARQKMEAQGAYYWAGVDLFYVAAMVLEAAGFPEHRAKLDKEARQPSGRALRIPDSYADDFVEEIEQLAPWRKVERFAVERAAL